MAIGKGDLISGKLGKLIGRIVDGEQIWQSRGQTPKQTKATKKSAALFGINSSLASYIRGTVCYNFDSDKTMISRLTSETYAIFRHCHDKGTNSFSFARNSYNRLKGFEFNVKSPLVNSLWVRPALSVADDKLIIKFPEISVPRDLRFPANAISCAPLMDIFLYTPSEGYFTFKAYDIEEISNVKGIVPAQEFKIDLPKGCICIVGLGLFYFSKQYTVKKLINSQEFSPAGICGVCINPGVTDLNDLREWNSDADIKLKNIEFVDSDELPPDLSTMGIVGFKTKSPKIGKTRKVMPEEAIITDDNPLIAVARNLQEMGLAVEDIVKATGLSAEEINRL